MISEILAKMLKEPKHIQFLFTQLLDNRTKQPQSFPDLLTLARQQGYSDEEFQEALNYLIYYNLIGFSLLIPEEGDKQLIKRKPRVRNLNKQEILRLRAETNLTNKEIANSLGCSVSTVEKTLSKARKSEAAQNE